MTALDPTQETILAIAFIVESSLPVYQQWSLILRDYLTHILKRLADAFSGSRMRVAFITYGPADMQQSPLLCKRFFVDHHIVFKEMKESPGKLGFGQANTGGDKGMAALEAHVAALELFDILNESSQAKRGRVLANFVIHVAACLPDSSQYPQWNELASLDRTTWDTLPHEYQKRNTAYNAIILSTQLPQFMSLHSALQQLRAESKPWFSVRPPHAVLLSGIPLAEPSSSLAKRTGDVEKTPESKRPRLVQNNPETPHGNGSTPTAHGELTQQASVSPIPVQRPFLAQFLAKVRALEDNIRGLEAKISEARLVANTELADKLSSDCQHQRDVLANFQRQVFQRMQSLKGMQSSTGLGNVSPSAAPVAPNQQDSPSTLLGNNHQKQTGADPPPNQLQTSDSSDVPNSSRDSNQGRATEPSLKSHGQSPHEQEHHVFSTKHTVSQSNPSGFSVHLRPQHSPNPVRGQQPNSPIVWQGQLVWNGLGPLGKKECRAKVVALSQTGAECRADTWPQQLTLIPTPEPAVSLPELREWITRFRPVICRFQSKSEPEDLTNEQYFKSLIQLLVAKKVFAVAGWTLPSGAQENNVLVFPMNDQALWGAFFPLTGIPEMPKPRAAGAQSSTLRLNPEFLAKLQRVPPEQRPLVMARLLQRAGPYPAGGVTAQAFQSSSDQERSQPQLHANMERTGASPHQSNLNGNSVIDPAQYLGTLQQLSSSVDWGNMLRAQGEVQPRRNP